MLKPDMPSAYSHRGEVYLRQGDGQKAFEDSQQAIKLDGKAAIAYELRSIIDIERTNYDAAQNDLDTAISLQPKNAGYYEDRGIFDVVIGNYDRAVSDLAQSERLAPKNADAIIWLHIARAKTGTDDATEIEQSVASIDQTRWPAPLIALYRRQLDPQKLLETAAQNKTDSAKPLRCAIYFHVAEYESLNRNLGQADDLFHKAIVDCAPYTPELVIAQKEVKARTR